MEDRIKSSSKLTSSYEDCSRSSMGPWVPPAAASRNVDQRARLFASRSMATGENRSKKSESARSVLKMPPLPSIPSILKLGGTAAAGMNTDAQFVICKVVAAEF
eukprot:517495-Prymnesium_polylepis.1